MNKIGKTEFLLSAFLGLLIPLDVYANSSWVWISEHRPYDVLPFAAAVTVITEIFMIKTMAGIERGAMPRLCGAVVTGNLLSFAFPYIIYLETSVDEGIYTFGQFMEHLPAYTIGFVFLAMTLIIEVPLVFLAMRKKAASGKKLIISIILSNTVTTVLTAMTERVISPGHW